MGQNSHISAEFDNVSSLNLFNLPFIEPQFYFWFVSLSDQYCCCFLVSLSLCICHCFYLCSENRKLSYDFRIGKFST